jgi:signal peptidase I
MATEALTPETSGDSTLSEAPARTQAPASALADFFESLLVTILLVLFATTFILQAFKIPSQSMEPTLLVGDHLLVNKFIFEGRGAWYEKLLPYRPVRRGDIIVFKFPYDDHSYYVKRVIGVPGDHIRIINERVYVNEVPLTEPYVVHDLTGDDPFADNFPPSDRGFAGLEVRPEWAKQIMSYVQAGELVVPPDRYFVMGDNRDRSWDSRYWGFVDRPSIMGRPIVIYWSVRATARDYTDRSLIGTARGIEATLIHLPSRTRWNRMLREVH